MYTSPKAYIGPGQRGPDNELLCLNCYQRYLAQTKSKIPREPGAWRSSGGNRSRKGMVMSKSNKTKSTEQLDSSSSDDDEPLRPKRDETRRGVKLKARVPDKDKCQSCFDYNLNCAREDNGNYSQCTNSGRICRPLALNPDGSLPAERRFQKSAVRHEPELGWEDRCSTCRNRNRKCDAVLPIHPKNPCTSCRKLNSYCCSTEQAQRMKDTEPCLRCTNVNKKCNRDQPCDVCIDAGHARCTYQVEDGARWLTTLTNPIAPDQRTSK